MADGLIGLGGFSFFATWIACAIIGGLAGQRKGAALVGVMLGLILGPFGAAFAIAMVGARGECLYCRELVRFQARKCPHCQSTLKIDPPAAAPPSSDA